MPQTLVKSAIIAGLSPIVIEIEASFTRGFAGLQLLGNASDVCREGKERAKIALEHLGYKFPQKRLILSCNPADIFKDGNHLDLAMAMTLAKVLALTSRRSVETEAGDGAEAAGGVAVMTTADAAMDPTTDYLFVAELTLFGELKPVRAMPALVIRALDLGMKGLVIARGNATDAHTLLEHLKPQKPFTIVEAGTLREVLEWWRTGVKPQPLERKTPPVLVTTHPTFEDMTLSEPQTQLAKIIATGFHHCLISGPPGVGKTMFAKRIPSLLPPLSPAEKIRALKIHGFLSPSPPAHILAGHRPVKSPHHSASVSALTGTDRFPGELSLATGGLLFLDELTEFRRDFLEALREPLEGKSICISRASGKMEWDADVLLIGSTNLCSCGNFGSAKLPCHCTSQQLNLFRRKLSGPLLDRIDLHAHFLEWTSKTRPSWVGPQKENVNQAHQLAHDVTMAQNMSFARNQHFGCTWNRDLKPTDFLDALEVTKDAMQDFIALIESRTSSRRALSHVLRTSRTLADLENRSSVALGHIAQSLGWLKESVGANRGFYE